MQTSQFFTISAISAVDVEHIDTYTPGTSACMSTGLFQVVQWFICPVICLSCCVSRVPCIVSGWGGGGRATPAQPASGGGCLSQPRWAVCATGVGAHQGQTSREGEKDIRWTARTACGGTGHLGRTETQRGRLWTACGQRCVDSKSSQTTPATTSTSSIRQLLGAADTQTAHHATFSTAPPHQLLGSANAETTPARAPAAAADRKQRPGATCEGKNG